MPTIQEIIAKRGELQATDPNATNVDARKALMQTAPIVNAPVAGQTPEITPTTPAPVNVNEQQRIDNQAKRQEMITQGQVPAVGQNSPTVTPTPVTPEPVATTPTAQTPVTTPTPTTPPVDKNAEIKAKNEAQMALNKQQAELRDQERKKASQEANNQLANDEGAILNTLRSGGIIPETVKTSPNYKNALANYNKLQQYSTYSVGDLTTALNQGSIIPGTSLYNEMMKDPAMKTKLTEAQIYKSPTAINTTQLYENASSEILSNNPTTATYLSDGIITQDEYDQATNNEAIVAKAKEVEEKANKYNTLKAEYDAIEDEVKAQFPGSPFADSIIADRQKAKYKNLQLAQGEWETATGTLTELKSQAASLFETNLKLYEQRRAEENAYKMANYQAQLGLQTKQASLQMESDFAKKLAQESMNDPYQAIPAMIEEYKKLGIPFTRSTQQIIQDFESSGQDLGTYLTELQKLVQSKPEYQAMQARKAGEGVSYQTFGDSVYRVNADGSLTKTDISAKSATSTQDWSKLDDTTLFNQRTGELKKVSPTEASAYGPSSVEVSPEAIKAISNRLSGDNVQCGMVSNDWMAQKFPGAKRMGDSYESKVASVESIGVSDVPQVGGVFAMNTYNSNGHTGIVQSVDLANGTFTATDANKAGKASGGPVTTSTYKISDNFTFSKGPAGTGTQSEDIKMQALSLVQGLGGTADERQAFADNVIKVARRDNISLAESKKKLGYKSADDVDFAKTRKEDIQSLKKDTRDKLSNANTALTLLNQPQTAIGDVASVVGFLKTIDPTSVARESEVASVENARGILDSLSNVFAKAKEGTKLTDTQRTQLKQAIQTIVDAGNAKYYESIYNTSQEFNERGLDPTVYISKNDVEKAKQIFGGQSGISGINNSVSQPISPSTPQNTDPDFDALYNSLP